MSIFFNNWWFLNSNCAIIPEKSKQEGYGHGISKGMNYDQE